MLKVVGHSVIDVLLIISLKTGSLRIMLVYCLIIFGSLFFFIISLIFTPHFYKDDIHKHI